MSNVIAEARAYLARTRDACVMVDDCVGQDARAHIEALVKEVERLLAENAALRALLPTITKVRTLRIDDPFNKGQ